MGSGEPPLDSWTPSSLRAEHGADRGEGQPSPSCDLVQPVEDRYCLSGQGAPVRTSHLHARRRNGPFGLFQVELAPFRHPELARPRKEDRHELQRSSCRGLGGMVPDEGIEPPTFGLQNRCTTAVLIRRPPFGCVFSSSSGAAHGQARRLGHMKTAPPGGGAVRSEAAQQGCAGAQCQ